MNYDRYIEWKKWNADSFGLVSAGSRFHFDQVFRSRLSMPKRVLEIGFGNGELLMYLREGGHEVVGVEINADLVARARQAQFQAYLGPVWEAPELSDAKFDLIVGLAVAEHMDYKDLVILFSWARTHLMAGAALCLKFPEGASPFGLGYQNGDFTHISCLTKSKIKALCAVSGMQLESYADELLVSNKLCTLGWIGRLGLYLLQFYAIFLKLVIRILLFPVCPSLKLSTNSIAVMTVADRIA